MVARAPRKRMYRTMQGRMVDIEKLRAANELSLIHISEPTRPY